MARKPAAPQNTQSVAEKPARKSAARTSAAAKPAAAEKPAATKAPAKPAAAKVTATAKSPAARKPAASKPATPAKPAPSLPSRALGVFSIGAAAVAVGAAIVEAVRRLRGRSSEGHEAPDLALGHERGPDDRAPEAFRPDPTAPVSASDREALRPATMPLGSGRELDSVH